MGIKSSWLASTDPNNKTGVAEYDVAGVLYKIRLESFDDYQKIESAILIAADNAREEAKSEILKAIREL